MTMYSEICPFCGTLNKVVFDDEMNIIEDESDTCPHVISISVFRHFDAEDFTEMDFTVIFNYDTTE